MLLCPLTNFETQKHYPKQTRFNGVLSRNNLPKIKEKQLVVNLDTYKAIGTYLIALYVNYDTVTYFDKFGVEYIPKEIENNSQVLKIS